MSHFPALHTIEDLASFYRRYSVATFTADEPLYTVICERVTERHDVLEIIAAHDIGARQPNLLLNAIRFLTLQDPASGLAEMLTGELTEEVGERFCDLVVARRGEVDHLLANQRTQTNEVGRAAPLVLAFADVAASVSEPLGWIDLGSSGGLNLLLDHFAVTLVGDDGSVVAEIGPSDSPVNVRCDVTGVVSPPPKPAIAWRMGVDRAPIDVTNPDQARWLEACVWPSRTDRLERLAGACELVRRHGVEVRPGDAGGLGQIIADAPPDTHLMITTTWVWYYLDDVTRAAAFDAMASAGRPITWISLEAPGVAGMPVSPSQRDALRADASALIRADFDGVRPVPEMALLGWAHGHGTWVDWTAS